MPTIKSRRARRLIRLGREALTVLGSNLGLMFVGLVGFQQIAQRLDAVELGNYGLAMTGVLLAQQSIFGPLSTATLRMQSVYSTGTDAVHAGLLLARRRALVVAGLVVVAVAVAALVLNSGRSSLSMALIGVLGFGVWQGYNAIYQTRHAALRQRLTVGVFRVGGAALRWTLAVVAVVLISSTYEIVIAAFAVAAAAQLYAQRRYASGHLQPPSAVLDPDPLLKYSRPFAILGLLIWARAATDRWALAAFVDKTTVGVYTVFFQLAGVPITAAGNAAANFLGPIIFDHAGDASDQRSLSIANKRTMQIAGLGICAGLAGSLVLFIFAKPLVHLFVDDPLPNSARWVAGVGVASSFWAGGQILGLSLHTSLRVTALYRPTIASVAFAVISSFALSRLWGLPGVVVSSMASAVAYYSLIVWAVLRPTPTTQNDFA